MKALELSGHGLIWLGICLAMLYFGFDPSLWMNMLMLQVLDIVLIALQRESWSSKIIHLPPSEEDTMRGQSQTLIFSRHVLLLMSNGSLIDYPNLIRINYENPNPMRYLKPIGQCTDLSHCERKWSGRKIGLRRENWILWVSRQEITLRSFVTQETTLSEPRIRNGLFPFHPLAIIIISIKDIAGSFRRYLWYMILRSSSL